ncbi:hypothetical protein [Streptosporangium roseum]
MQARIRSSVSVYRGTRKNLFDLRRTAVVHNLHVIARRQDSYRLTA